MLEKKKREVESMKQSVIEFVLNLVQVRSRRKIQKVIDTFLCFVYSTMSMMTQIDRLVSSLSLSLPLARLISNTNVLIHRRVRAVFIIPNLIVIRGYYIISSDFFIVYIYLSCIYIYIHFVLLQI